MTAMDTPEVPAPAVTTAETPDGFVYQIDGGPPSRLWPTREKAQQAGEDYAAFLAGGAATATPVDGTPSLKTPLEPPADTEGGAQ